MPYDKITKKWQPEFIILVGLSGCGKSTWAKNFIKENKDMNDNLYTIISSDEIRKELTGSITDQTQNEEVFRILHKRVKSILSKGESVIVDATNLKLKNRKAYFNLVENISCLKVCLIFNVTVDECITRQDNSDRELHLTSEIIKRQEMGFEIPFYEEGWNYIYFVDNKGEIVDGLSVKSIDTVRNTELYKKQIGFNQKTHHHLYTLDEHSDRVADALRKYDFPFKQLEQFWCKDGKVIADSEAVYNKYKQTLAKLIEVAYIHDYGKLFVGTPKDDGSGDYRYYSHHNVSAYEIMNHMEQLGLRDNDDILDFLFYVNYHMQPFFISTEKAENKWRKIFGNWRYEMLTIFNECDIIGSGTRK